MKFNDALGMLLAEITPRPWAYTDAHGSTLTIEPAGLPAERDEAEVVFSVGEAAEWLRTPAVERLVEALTAGESWADADYGWGLTAEITGETVTVSVIHDHVPAPVVLPASERMPLVSAIRRALDAARGWEDDAR